MNETIESQLEKTGFYVSTTVGCSMRPMLRNRRDRVILRKKETSERLRRLDLPLYRRPDGTYVLHRVIGVREGYYVIRGDNTFVREKVPEEWILGVMTEFYRGNKRVPAQKKSYRAYAALWQFLYPLRFCLHLLRAGAGKIKRKLFPPKKKDGDNASAQP